MSTTWGLCGVRGSNLSKECTGCCDVDVEFGVMGEYDACEPEAMTTVGLGLGFGPTTRLGRDAVLLNVLRFGVVFMGDEGISVGGAGNLAKFPVAALRKEAFVPADGLRLWTPDSPGFE